MAGGPRFWFERSSKARPLDGSVRMRRNATGVAVARCASLQEIDGAVWQRAVGLGKAGQCAWNAGVVCSSSVVAGETQ